MAGLLKCQKCSQFGDRFKLIKLDDQTGNAVVVCLQCGEIQEIQADLRCCICGEPYWEVLWNMPSRCKRCCRSFVE